jgi:S1-C subfamily serine protease
VNRTILIVIPAIATATIVTTLLTRACVSNSHAPIPGTARYDEVVAFPVDGDVVTLFHYLETGRQRAERFIDGRAREVAGLRATQEKACSACVRVDIEIGSQGGTTRAVNGSGILVDGGRHVITAGHGFEDGPGNAIRITLSDGRVREGLMNKSRYAAFENSDSDWAIIDIGDSAGLPALEAGEAKVGSVAYALGYPSQIGIDAAGHLVPAYTAANSVLAPLIFPVRVRTVDPITLTPLAGAVPLGGISGGPVVDEEGRVIAVFVSVLTHADGDSISYFYGAASVAEIAGKWRNK